MHWLQSGLSCSCQLHLKTSGTVSSYFIILSDPRFVFENCWNICPTRFLFSVFFLILRIILIDTMQSHQAIATVRKPVWSEQIKKKVTDIQKILDTDTMDAAVRCSYCSQRSLNLLRCSRCKEMYYCSRECQRGHWREGHRDHCVSLNNQGKNRKTDLYTLSLKEKVSMIEI